MQQPIKNLTLILTYACNLACKMCGQAQAPSHAPNSPRQSNDQLPLDAIKKIIDAIPSLESVYLVGGETLLYRDIVPLLAYVFPRNICVDFSTNGILLDRYIDPILENKVHMLSISIDSHIAREHDEIRGMEGLFDIAMQNAEKLLNERAMRRYRYPYVKIHFTITPYNYKRMIDYYEYMIRRFPDVHTIMFHLPRFVTPRMGKKYTRVMQDAFGCEAISWQGFVDHDHAYEHIDLDLLYDQIETLIKRPRVAIKGIVDKTVISEYFTNPEKMFGNDCDFYERACVIQPNGDVVTCSDYPDVVVGNIHDQTIQQIWEGSEFNAFRTYMRREKSLPICAKCSRRFVDEKSFVEQ